MKAPAWETFTPSAERAHGKLGSNSAVSDTRHRGKAMRSAVASIDIVLGLS
jgi:hypothetical protein